MTDHPGELAKGNDPQLDAAVAELMRRIREDPPALPAPPADERRIVTDSDGGNGTVRVRLAGHGTPHSVWRTAR